MARVSAKALIVRDGRLLLVRCTDAQGPWWLLPGGGQEHGEPLHDALRRECREEIGADVRVGALLYVRDYIGRNHEFKDEDPDVHQVELMFACDLAPGADPRVGDVPDKHQSGIDWIEIPRLAEVRFYPRALGRILARGADSRADGGHEVVYLGDVN